jgi:hypothetical protein
MEGVQMKELLLQALEHERGGVRLYEAAIECADNEELKDEWERYHSETRRHVEVLEDVITSLGLDPEETCVGRDIVAALGEALIEAVEHARATAEPAAAQIVAAECIVLAETKDHLNWELIGRCADAQRGDVREALQAAYEEVEDQEDEHLYHTRGWARELWIESLGMQAVLPPPEERKHVKTAIGAARAEQGRRPGRSH